MRCPHCGSPVPLGSALCIDCGAKLNVKEWNPWDEQEHTTARKNTGEREYKLNNIRQRVHEQTHTAHSTSKEAERDYEGKPHKARPAASRPTAPRPAAQRAAAAEKPAKTTGKGWAIIIALFVLIGAVSGSCESLMSDFGDNEVISEIESFLDDSGFSDSDTYVYEGGTEYYDDGSYDAIWYDENDEVTYVDHFDANDNQVYEEHYIDGQLDGRFFYDEDGYLTVAEFYENGELSQVDTTEYYDDGAVKSDIYTNGDGVVCEEWYYDEDGDITGYVEHDETTGEVTDAWGIDADGNDLEEMYSID